jgi:signal transduction histidine kinase
MQNANNLFGYDSLAFFGRVNASISHELKNIMAIISETAGLLGDLSEMASTGTPVDPDLLKSSAESIIEEIQRGFTTIRQMNRFSHSVDVPVSSVNLLELLDLVRHLSDYLPFSGKIRLAPWEGDPPMVQTCAYQLQALVYEVTVRHLKNSGPDVELDITVEQRSDAGWDIVFSGLYIGEYQAFPDDQINQSAGSINVNLEWDRANEYLRLQLPLTIPSSVPSADDSVQDLDDGGARSL